MNNYQLAIKNYQLYKDSGVAWLGDVPEHWELSRIKSLTKTKSGTTPKSGTDEYYENGTHFWIRTTDLNNDRLFSSEFKVTDLAIENNGLTFIQPKSILIAMYGGMGTIGKNSILEVEATINQSVCAIFPNTKKFNSVYLWYYLQFFRPHWEIFADSARKDPNINQEAIKRLWVAVPPLNEQKSIATYLDTKTAQCDRKIDLLTQKATQYGKLKQSLINETVTRGLDKSVPMKDSGIEWVGEVPEHWKVKRVKEVFTISRGRVIAQTELIENGHYPVYSSQTKDDGCLGYINTFDYEGDYITWTTDGVNAGTIFLRQGRFNCTNICGTLKLNEKNHFIGYLFYALQVSAKHNKRIDTNGAKIMSNEMMFIKISIPPLSEQKASADYLDKKTAQINQIIQTINTQIEKLKELRKTLINDVVTGKIKV